MTPGEGRRQQAINAAAIVAAKQAALAASVAKNPTGTAQSHVNVVNATITEIMQKNPGITLTEAAAKAAEKIGGKMNWVPIAIVAAVVGGLMIMSKKKRKNKTA